jgi:serine protease Do
VCSLLSFASAQSEAPGRSGTEKSASSSQAGSVLQAYDQALDEVAERAMLSVVEIKVSGYGPREDDTSSQVIERQRAMASGVIVSADGYLITNNHVVADAQRIRVILAPATVELVTYHTSLAHRQRAYEARLIGARRKEDLALIEIEEKSLPFIALAEQFRVRLGQTVLAIGSPEGLDHTVTKGIVSAVGRQPELDRPMVYVQTDARAH